MELVVATRQGSVQGQIRDGVASFLGIPYAASPTGGLRFAAPAPPQAWTGVREATALGPTPPKPDYTAPFDVLLADPNIAGGDWLNLNVWAPRETSGAVSPRPVMVWIHGGAFQNGNSAVPHYDGHAFAKSGVVLVSVNYRLGVDGFAYIAGAQAPANRGLLDQVAALEWVRDNIAAFGGDPGNVTIFGESAGAMSVLTLLCMPRAAGLFNKAIAQSGATQAAADPADAALVTAELAKLAGTSDFASLDLDALNAAQATVRDALGANPDPARFGMTIVASWMPFIPVIDGDVLPVHPAKAITDGASAQVPLLIGTNAEEFRFFVVPSGRLELVTAEALPFAAAAVGATQDIVDRYQANRPDATAGDVFAALVTDRYFRLPALGVAEARSSGGTGTGAAAPASTYVYEFTWGNPPVGAGHSLEIPFVFDNLSHTDGDLLIGPNPPQDLADDMHSAWVRFAVTGDPGWPAYDESRPVRIFDTGGGSIDYDPRGDERAIWPSASATATETETASAS